MTTYMTGEGELDVGVSTFPEGVVAVGDSARPSNLFRLNLGEPTNVFIVCESFRFHGDPGCCDDPESYKKN